MIKLHGVPRTALVVLACHAIESSRPDGLLHDRRAVEVYQALGGSRDFLMGLSGEDILYTCMRARQFDAFARTFLANHPGGLVVDLGCGLETRFERLDDGQCCWLGVDLPEVIDLRGTVLPDTERSQTIAQSMLEISWLDEVERINKPVIFLAEGVFPYFSTASLRPMMAALAARFPGGELVLDATGPLLTRLHNLSSSVLKRSGVRMQWDAKAPEELESWGLRCIRMWGELLNRAITLAIQLARGADAASATRLNPTVSPLCLPTITSAEGENTMDYQETIIISRPITEVWVFFQEARNDFGWQADLLGQKIIYKSPTGIGTIGREKRKSLGESTWEVTEIILEQKLAYKSTSSEIPYQGSYLFESVEAGTKFTSAVHLELSGLWKLASPIVEYLSRKQLVINLHRLKDMLEM